MVRRWEHQVAILTAMATRRQHIPTQTAEERVRQALTQIRTVILQPHIRTTLDSQSALRPAIPIHMGIPLLPSVAITPTHPSGVGKGILKNELNCREFLGSSIIYLILLVLA